MNQELCYPIKYAVLELKETGGWEFGYEDITRGFIVSKCYVVESNVKYFASGKSETTHKVVFPFKNIPNYGLSQQHGFSCNDKAITPSYDACERPYPVDIVSDLFDNYEEASLLASQKNEKMRSELILGVSISDPNWQEKYEKLKTEFSRNLDCCQKFEELILMKTDDMIISEEAIETPKIITKRH